MNTFLDKLNLRPQEQRLVVMGLAALFIVLQFWFVWPHFKDWGQVRTKLKEAQDTLAMYQKEIARTNEYIASIERLGQEGSATLAEESARPNILISQIQVQATRSRLNSGSITPVAPTRVKGTNLFFDETTITLGVNPTGDDELVDFLVAMGSSELMVRVKQLDIRPDTSQTKLMGTMQLVASFQKNILTRPSLR